MYQCNECGREFTTPFMTSNNHGRVFGCPYCGNNYSKIAYQNDKANNDFIAGGESVKKYLEFIEDFAVAKDVVISAGETVDVSGEDDTNYYVDAVDLADYIYDDEEGLFFQDLSKELEGITYFAVTEEGVYE